jgi:transcriptional regulator with GAF, ATPase, and Fis domain
VAFWEGGFAECGLPDEGSITIGRSRTCDLSVQHATVSREHARLILGNPPILADCGSSNGTKVAGMALSPGEQRAVQPGDLIELGSAVIAVQDPSPEIAPGHQPPNFDELLTMVADSDISVVILGETGVGKERAAEQIHERSRRRQRRFVRINCAALVESLLESELFGHERGAFTGAHKAKLGMLEAAHGGSVFLDEVAELSPGIQAKLLRVLESGEVMRVGSIQPCTVDVRFISATNESLDERVAMGAFRRDLYFRLAGMTLLVPPLRERRSELPALAQHFVQQACESQGRPTAAISSAAMTLLCSYGYPGNIRELRNVVERALVLSRGAAITPEYLQIGTQRPSAAPPAPGSPAHGLVPRQLVEEIERRRIVEALEQTGGNQTAAAALLGISRRTLVNRLAAFDLPRPRKR